MNVLEVNKSTIIALIQSAFGMHPQAVSLTRDDIPIIEAFANQQSILPLIIAGLENMGYSELLTDSMNTGKLRTTYDYIQRNEALKEISAVLDEAGIDYIPLKGAVLRNLYPQPWMRTSSDIDILIRETEIQKASKVIEDKTSFHQCLKGFHDVHYSNNRVHLELHFNLLDDVEGIDRIMQLAWDYASQSGEGRRYVFSPEYHLFYIAAHACKHFIGGGGIGIRPMIDIWLLRTLTVYNEATVEQLCSDAGILKFYQVCGDLLESWFDNKDKSDVVSSFEELVFSGGVFGSPRSRVLAKRRKGGKLKYAFSRLFIKNSRLKGVYPICKKYPILIPFFQIKRWFKLLLPSKQRKIRKELKVSQEIQQEEVGKYDALLKDLGL